MGTVLFLAFLALLYRFQADAHARGWYIFCAGVSVLVFLGWRPSQLSFILAIGVFKVVKDICLAGDRS